MSARRKDSNKLFEIGSVGGGRGQGVRGERGKGEREREKNQRADGGEEGGGDGEGGAKGRGGERGLDRCCAGQRGLEYAVSAPALDVSQRICWLQHTDEKE